MPASSDSSDFCWLFICFIYFLFHMYGRHYWKQKQRFSSVLNPAFGAFRSLTHCGWLLNKKAARIEVNISLAFLHWVGIALHPWPFEAFVSDIAIFVVKEDVRLQLTADNIVLQHLVYLCVLHDWMEENSKCTICLRRIVSAPTHQNVKIMGFVDVLAACSHYMHVAEILWTTF